MTITTTTTTTIITEAAPIVIINDEVAILNCNGESEIWVDGEFEKLFDCDDF